MKRNQSVLKRGTMALSKNCCIGVLFLGAAAISHSQEPAEASANLQDRIRILTDAMDRMQSQMKESQRQLDDLRQQVAALRASAGMENPAGPDPQTGAADLKAAVAVLRETQQMHDSQLATLAQSKIESASKYPVVVNGTILMTAFVNTRAVDMPATPAIAIPGAGATGATLEQTTLGLDASGPHLFGARSHADLRFDLSGGSPFSGYDVAGKLRMRTAHAELAWDRSRAYFALDRPLLSPDTPTSLTAVAEPPLAWSGNLWTWNPQLGASFKALPIHTGSLQVEGALIDVADPPATYENSQGAGYAPPGAAELSRWPGVQARIAYVDDSESSGARFGVGGYFAPHRTPSYSIRFNSWATAVDMRIPFRFTEVSGSAYRGQALGGLGGGAYKDYVARFDGDSLYSRALDDVGGWLQWKQRISERLQFNEALGTDTVPAHQLRPFASASPTAYYYNLARNRTITGNVIYSPSAYLLFSLEYRRIASSFVTSPTVSSDVIGVGTGYRF